MEVKLHGVYVGNGTMLCCVQYGARLFLPSNDMHVMPLLVQRGVHEVGLTNHLLRTLQPGMRVVDIGANCGYFTVLIAHRVGTTGTVDAFEPMGDIRHYLNSNIVCNYVSDITGHHVTVHPEAVGDTVGERTIHWSLGEEAGASLRGQFGDFQETLKEATVPCTTLDASLRGDFDFIKIDAEGNELRVLRGARETLKRTKRFTFELNRTVLGADYEPLFDLLANLDAEFFQLSSDGLQHPVTLDGLRTLDFEPHVLVELHG